MSQEVSFSWVGRSNNCIFSANPVKRSNIEGAMDGNGMVQQMGFGAPTSMIPTVASAAEAVVEVISVPENTVGLGKLLHRM